MAGTRALKPRSLVGLYDAALEITVTTPSVVALAWLGAAPVACLGVALWYVGAEGVPFPGDVWLLALLCGLATLWRAVPGGAVSRIVIDHLAGRPPDTRAALREAFGRGPSLLAGAAVGLWILALSVPFLLLPLLFWGGVCLAAPLILERVCPPWAVGGASRRLLGDRATVSGGLTLIWVVALATLALNLVALSALLLYLGRSLAHLDVGYLGVLLSPQNPVFFPAIAAIAFLVLEPVRQVSLALIYVDARIRAEGLDLRAALDALPAPRKGRKAAASGSGRAAAVLLVAVAGVGTAWPAQADPYASDDAFHETGDTLHVPGADSDLMHEGADALHEGFRAEAAREVTEALDAMRPAVPPEDAAAFERLRRRVERDLAGGRDDLALRRIEEAWFELEAEAPAGGGDPRHLAERILMRPEFQRVDRTASRTAERPRTRFFERFLDWLDRLERRDRRAPRTLGGEGLATVSRTLWGLLLVVLAALVVWWVVRAFSARTAAGEAIPDEEAAETTTGRNKPGVLGLDPLSRSPDAWLAEADRLAAEGRHRDALRAAYLSLLAQLHRSRAIDYQPTRTNWDHARAFRGPEDDRRTFTDLTRRFDRAWYGLRGVAPEDYREVRAGALSLGATQEARGG